METYTPIEIMLLSDEAEKFLIFNNIKTVEELIKHNALWEIINELNNRWLYFNN